MRIHFRTDFDPSRCDAFDVTRCGRRVAELGAHPEDYGLREGEAPPVPIAQTTPSIFDVNAPVTCPDCLAALAAQFPNNARVAQLLEASRRSAPAPHLPDSPRSVP